MDLDGAFFSSSLFQHGIQQPCPVPTASLPQLHTKVETYHRCDKAFTFGTKASNKMALLEPQTKNQPGRISQAGTDGSKNIFRRNEKNTPARN